MENKHILITFDICLFELQKCVLFDAVQYIFTTI